MTRTVAVAALVAVCALCGGVRADAQTPDGRFEIGIGPMWIGAAGFGTIAANETTATGGAVPLFSTETKLLSALGVEARIAVRIGPRFDVEVVGSYAGPHLQATVTSDAEAGSGPFISEEWIQQFTVGGRLVWRFARRASGRRWTPFAAAGAQHVRQLHEQQTLLVTGRLYEAGVGITYLIGSRAHARLKAVGVRGELRAIVREGGVNTDGRAHASPAIGASLFVRF